jgi:arsenite methyltransferase
MAEQELTAEEIRERVREGYAAAARAAPSDGCGCGSGVFGAALYDREARALVPESAVGASLGCGNPTAVAELHEGEVVLDLGSGGGADVLLSAKRVGETGRAYGLDMTDEMLELARGNAARAGVSNVEWLRGEIEHIPLPDESVDVVISNCVINLSADKPQVFREAARVLRPGGRFAVTDVLADEDMNEETRRDFEQWTGCIAGALTTREFETELGAAGLEDIAIRETHRVHPQAGSAIVRARKPLDPAAIGCSLTQGEARERRATAGPVAAAARHTERRGDRLTIEFGPELDEELLRELVAAERECCPFFDLDYDPGSRRLVATVADAEHRPGLDALADLFSRP